MNSQIFKSGTWALGAVGVVALAAWWVWDGYRIQNSPQPKPAPAIIKTSDDDGATTRPAPPRRPYHWISTYSPADSIAQRIPAPNTYERVGVEPGLWGDWLRGLPLKQGQPPVKLFNGQERPNQPPHIAVLDLDVGDKDLQQSADAIIRLRAEYQYSARRFASVHFYLFPGKADANFTKWADDYRPRVQGTAVTWTRSPGSHTRDVSYANFRKYLDAIFPYTGIDTLATDLQPVVRVTDMSIGEVFIQAGHPGNAAIVVDVAERKEGMRKCFLLARAGEQGQEMYIIKNTNPRNEAIWPWFDVNFGSSLNTGECTFVRADLKQFRAR